jgi:hypothetical protein
LALVSGLTIDMSGAEDTQCNQLEVGTEMESSDMVVALVQGARFEGCEGEGAASL